MIEDQIVTESLIFPLCFTTTCLKIATRRIDRVEWRCMNYKCRFYLSNYSIRTGSWIEQFNISSRVLYKIIIYWSSGLNQKNILRFIGVGRNTLSKFRRLIINRIKTYFERNPISLGGVGIVVQIDETMINHKIKAHRRRTPNIQTWLLCITDTSFVPARGFCCILENRTAAHFIPIISKVVGKDPLYLLKNLDLILINQKPKIINIK
jgi:hypothetical protein